MNEPLWAPRAATEANLDHFRRKAELISGRRLPDYPALHTWSIEEPAAFWQLMSENAGVVWQRSANRVAVDEDQFLKARWFEGAELNFAENLLREKSNATALVAYLENGARTEMSYAELGARVAACAMLFRELGVVKGDRVAGWLPNIAETIVAMLAAASLGAVWSSCSPDFGASGALDRFGQIGPKLLIGCDGYHYNGKTFDTREKINAVADAVETIERVLWVAVLGRVDEPDLNALIDARLGAPAHFEPCAFDDPLYILYSSGTTGMPKCIVHGVGGTLLQHLKEQALHTDLSPGDRLLFFTTCGWMMWNWLVSGLAIGVTLILYDGSPFHPGPEALLDIADRERVTHFGASAKYLQALENADLTPRESHDLASVRVWLSTGSPLNPEGFEYVYQRIKADVQLASISGGTDIVSCFVLGNPCAPVYAGEIQCKGLGMAVDVWNDAGDSVVGEKGELVCTRPFPLHAHGILERSRATKISGRLLRAISERVGTWRFCRDYRQRRHRYPWPQRRGAEPPAACGSAPQRSIVRWNNIPMCWKRSASVRTGRTMCAWCCLSCCETAPGWTKPVKPTSALVFAQTHRRGTYPLEFWRCPDIPRTMSGKIAELAVRETIHGRSVKNTAALANPNVLSAFANRAELDS